MATPPDLPSCPFLSYILSLLDKSSQVLTCRLVCRKLQSVIETDYHLMKRPQVRLTIRTTRKEGDAYNIEVDNCSGTRYSSFNIEFRPDGSYQYHSTKSESKGPFSDYVRRKKLEERATSEVCFNDVLFEIMKKFEVTRFDADFALYLPAHLISLVVERINKTGTRTSNCYLATPRHWEIPYTLHSSYVKIETLESLNEIDLLRTKGAEIVIGGDGEMLESLAPFKRILKEWVAGEREMGSFGLYTLLGCQYYAFTVEEVKEMLVEFNCQFLPSKEEDIISLLGRKRDAAIISFVYNRQNGAFSINEHACGRCVGDTHIY